MEMKCVPHRCPQSDLYASKELMALSQVISTGAKDREGVILQGFVVCPFLKYV